MSLRPGLTITTPSEADQIAQSAISDGVPVFVMSTSGTRGRQGFFDAVRGALPLDPPLVSANSWDALDDSLFEGLMNVAAHRLVIVWRDASPMDVDDPEDLETALSVLSHVAELMTDPVATAGEPKEVCIYVGRTPDY